MNKELALDIQAELEDPDGDGAALTSGEEVAFGRGTYYRRRVSKERGDGSSFWSNWNNFEATLKRTSRFFNPKAQEVLGEVFHDLADQHNWLEGTILIEAGPGTNVSNLFRARVF